MKIKHLVKSIKGHSGLNCKGRVSLWHRGGGNNFLLRDRLINTNTIVHKPLSLICYNPRHSSPLSLTRNLINNKINYTTTISNTTLQSTPNDLITSTYNIISHLTLPINSTFPLSSMNIGSYVTNISNKYLRSSGCYGQVVDKSKDYVIIYTNKMNYLTLDSNLMGTIIEPSLLKVDKVKFNKAGNKRWIGKRPVVRGEAMSNDKHPQGGNTKNGKLPKNRWGKLIK